MVSHKGVLSRKVVLSWQALFRVPQVVSLRTSGGCGHRRNLGTVSSRRAIALHAVAKSYSNLTVHVGGTPEMV